MVTKATRCRKLREHLKKGDNNNDGDGGDSPPPLPYLSNSSKEAECLSYLAAISKDYDSSCSTLQWLLSARNEYGTLKPLPTYIRPTLLPHPNLYDLKDLLQFVFRHVTHENWLVEEEQSSRQQAEDDDGDGCQITIASPNQTLKWRSGDSLDQSVLLASLLLGAGYDAYVVVGTAPDWLRRGETDLLCIGNDDDDWRGGHGGAESCSRFGWRGMPFTEVPVDVRVENDGNGSSNGVHAWVMVRPGRRCDDGNNGDGDDENALDASTVFADPAVGRIWSAEDDSSSFSSSPYFSIQTIWNQSNQWIHLSSTASEACTQIPSYIDLEDENAWRPLYGSAEGEDDYSSLHVLVPASWVEKIRMPVPYPPKEHRVELYDNATLELSTTSANNNVTSRKLTRYDDKERMEETEAIETFQGRPDHLLERHTLTSPNQTFTEMFSEFHPLGLRRWTETLSVERAIEFHPRIRTDGLVCRIEEYGDEKIDEAFRFRPDGLTQRVIRVARISEGDYAPKGALILNQSDGEEIALYVVEIQEHYGDLDDIKARLEADNVLTEQAVTSRIFDLVENRISVTRICHDGVDIVTSTEIIKKEKAGVSQYAMIGGDYDGGEALNNNSTEGAFVAERDSISSVVSINEDILHLCRVRYNEERKWLVQHDEAPTNSVTAVVSKEEEEETPGANTEEPCDYLAPFLIGTHDVHNISSEEAERIKDACLGSLKDRLLQRAQIMQSKLDEEKKVVEESRDSDGDGAAERIRVWEQRLEQHEALSLDKFLALQEKLNSDVRLQRVVA